MSYKLLEIVSRGGLTEELLVEIEGLQAVPGERTLKKPRLAFIQNLIETMQFNRCDWASCHCKEDDATYRVNGQHTSEKLREVLNGEVDGAEFPGDIPVIWSRYECDEINDLGSVFDCLDHHRSTRSPDDRLGVFMAEHSDLVGIDKEICSRVLAGIAWAIPRVTIVEEACDGASPTDAYDRGMLLHVDIVRDFIDLMHQHSGSPFKEWKQKTGIVASLFTLFLSNRESAELAIEQMVYEAGDKAEEFTKKIRSSCAKTGKDQGYYYRLTDKYIKYQLKDMEKLGRDAIKAMIKEVIDEGDDGEESGE